jgi:hypothetical protein
MGKLSIAHVASAIKRVRTMSTEQRVALTDEILAEQPHLLA